MEQAFSLVCINCKKEAIYTNRRRFTEARRKGRAYCSDECKKSFLSQLSSKTMRETNLKNRDILSERMKTKNPMFTKEILERMTKSMKGKKFKERGGNGGFTKQQLVLHEATGYQMEYAINTKDARGRFDRIPNSYKADLTIPEKKVAIEIDGKNHSRKSIKLKDAKKTEVLNFLGWKVLRFTNEQINTNLNGCIKAIQCVI